MKNAIRIIASFFYLGYSPVIPGTAGTLGALALYLLWRNNLFLHTVFLAVIIILGFLVCGPAEKVFQQKDSPKIVIDEAAGLLLAFWGLNLDSALVVTGFFIFRAMDAVKPPPAARFEKIKAGSGVMLDDLVAGIYTNLVLQIVTRIFFPVLMKI